MYITIKANGMIRSLFFFHWIRIDHVCGEHKSKWNNGINFITSFASSTLTIHKQLIMNVLLQASLRGLFYINTFFMQPLFVYGLKFDKASGVKLRTSYKTLAFPNIIKCCASCSRDGICTGVSYQRTTGQCALYAFSTGQCEQTTNATTSACPRSSDYDSSTEFEIAPEWDAYGRLRSYSLFLLFRPNTFYRTLLPCPSCTIVLLLETVKLA